MTVPESIPYIEAAIASPRVNQIEEELSRQGYIEQEIKVFIIQTPNNSSFVNISTVAIVYRNNETDAKTILFINNEETGISSTNLANSNVSGLSDHGALCVFLSLVTISACPSCAVGCAVDAILEDSGMACFPCMAGCVGAFGAASIECGKFCCESGNDWCCWQMNPEHCEIPAPTT